MPVRLRSDSEAPAADPAVVKRLHALNPSLYVVWKRYRIDCREGPNQGRYLIAERGPFAGRPIPFENGGGRWMVFSYTDKGNLYLFTVQGGDWPWEEIPAGHFAPLDQRTPDKLLLDAARIMSPEELAQTIEDRRQYRTDKLRKLLEEIKDENLKQNKRKIGEVLEHGLTRGDEGYRDPRIFSYDGQGQSRGTRNETIRTTAEEDGYEIVDVRREMERARRAADQAR